MPLYRQNIHFPASFPSLSSLPALRLSHGVPEKPPRDGAALGLHFYPLFSRLFHFPANYSTGKKRLQPLRSFLFRDRFPHWESTTIRPIPPMAPMARRISGKDITPLLSDFHISVCRIIQHLPRFREPGAVAGTVPGMLRFVPFQGAAQMGTGSRRTEQKISSGLLHIVP